MAQFDLDAVLHKALAGISERNPYNDAQEQDVSSSLGIVYKDSAGKSRTLGVKDYEINAGITASSNRWVVVYHRASTSREREFITIHSDYIQSVFRSQVPNAPNIVYKGRETQLDSPYSALFFHLSQLKEYVRNDKSPGAQPLEFRVLSEFYKRYVKHDHDAVRVNLENGVVRFEDLWALFEPGGLVYTCDDLDQPAVCMVSVALPKEVFSGDVSWASKFRGRVYGSDIDMHAFCVDVWRIQWDPAKRHFYRQVSTFMIPNFNGSLNITSLRFYPLRYYAGGDQKSIDSLLHTLEARGREWKNLVPDPCCRHHRGAAVPIPDRADDDSITSMNLTRVKLDDRVMVDSSDSHHQSGDIALNIISAMDLGTHVDRARSRVREQIEGSEFTYFDDHPPEKPFSQLQAQLCPSTVLVVGISADKRYMAAIPSLSKVDWNQDSFKSLVLEPSRKMLLQDLVSQYQENQMKIASDIIRGKGKGLVIVLHGPSGVGKTMTAETVAEYTKKPLLPINVDELTMEHNVVDCLQTMFRKASHWGAVLLLDEADVVLEKRSFEDLKRNGIVSVFLRMLEYFEGIVFLTTNRVETMDPAFHSRIHIALRYQSLTPETRRKIWINFINQLSEEEDCEKDELLAKLDQMSSWSLHGRHIRNIMTVARSIALSRGLGLRFQDISRVARETLQFQESLDNFGHERRGQLADVVGHAWQGGREAIMANPASDRFATDWD